MSATWTRTDAKNIDRLSSRPWWHSGAAWAALLLFLNATGLMWRGIVAEDARAAWLCLAFYAFSLVASALARR